MLKLDFVLAQKGLTNVRMPRVMGRVNRYVAGDGTLMPPDLIVSAGDTRPILDTVYWMQHKFPDARVASPDEKFLSHEPFNGRPVRGLERLYQPGKFSAADLRDRLHVVVVGDAQQIAHITREEDVPVSDKEEDVPLVYSVTYSGWTWEDKGEVTGLAIYQGGQPGTGPRI